MEDLINLNTIFAEATMKVTLSKGICFEMPENYTQEELLERAKKEILTPNEELHRVMGILRNFGIAIDIDYDWKVENVEVI